MKEQYLKINRVKEKVFFVMNKINYKIDDDIEEVDEENQNETENTRNTHMGIRQTFIV